MFEYENIVKHTFSFLVKGHFKIHIIKSVFACLSKVFITLSFKILLHLLQSNLANLYRALFHQLLASILFNEMDC